MGVVSARRTVPKRKYWRMLGITGDRKRRRRQGKRGVGKLWFLGCGFPQTRVSNNLFVRARVVLFWAGLPRAMRRVAAENREDLTRFEQRLRDRQLELLARSSEQDIDAKGARPISIEVIRGSAIAGVPLARHYRVNDYLAETPRLHVRVTFDRLVAGPVAVGGGRHVGFGLLWPTDS